MKKSILTQKKNIVKINVEFKYKSKQEAIEKFNEFQSLIIKEDKKILESKKD